MKSTVDATKWNDYLHGAVQAFRIGDLDLAEKRLTKAFSARGGDAIYPHLLAGRVALARGQLKQALQSWRQVLKMDPNNPAAWNNLGVLYRRAGETKKALAAFLKAQSQAPERPDIPYNIGNLFKADGQHHDAEAGYLRAVEIDPNYAPAYNNLGTLYESRNERNKALEVFRRGLAADGSEAFLRFNIGLVYQEQGRWEAAKGAFDSVLKNRPGWPPGLSHRGIVLQKMGEEDEAARTFRALLDIEPDNIEALNNLGVSYERLGRADDARRCFRDALTKEPRFLTAALNLHDSLRENQELTKALDELNKQVNFHPTDPAIRVRMAQTLMSLSRWDAAEQSLEHVLERDPANSEALRTKADLCLATDRPEEAESVLAQLPHDAGAMRDLVKVNIRSEHSESAERILRELLAENPDDAEGRRLLAGLISRDRPEEALRLRQEAEAADPGNTENLISLASLHGRLGSKDMSLGRLDEAVSILAARGEADDLDTMDTVLGLYENASAALENEREDLFSKRTAQLGRKLQSVMGVPTDTLPERGRSTLESLPLEEDDALSLLDINSMEPTILVNEDEQTIYLDESAEDLTDAYTELPDWDRVQAGDNRGPIDRGGRSGAYPAHTEHPSPDSRSSGDSVEEGSHTADPGGPQPPKAQPPGAVHPAPGGQSPAAIPVILSPMSPNFLGGVQRTPVEQVPAANPLSRRPSERNTPGAGRSFSAAPPAAGPHPPRGNSASQSTPTGVPSPPTEYRAFYPDGSPVAGTAHLPKPETYRQGKYSTTGRPDFKADNQAASAAGEAPGSEDLPHSGSPSLPTISIEDLLIDDLPTFADEASEAEEARRPDDAQHPANGSDIEERPENGEPLDQEPLREPCNPKQLAELFEYLTTLIDDVPGEKRQQVVNEGIPLALASIRGRITGEPNFRDVAKRFDRRREERHGIQLNPETIRESLGAFTSLADELPLKAVGDSLKLKLDRVISDVEHLGDDAG